MILSPDQREELRNKFNALYILGGLYLVKAQMPLFAKAKQEYLKCLIIKKADEIMRIPTGKEDDDGQ